MIGLRSYACTGTTEAVEGVLGLKVGIFSGFRTTLFVILILLGGGTLCFFTLRQRPDRGFSTVLICSHLMDGLLSYRLETGDFPSEEKGLERVIARFGGDRKWLNDSWGQAIIYTLENDTISLRSSGRDGELGTKDDLVVTRSWGQNETPATPSIS